MINAVKHFITITRHKYYVFIHCVKAGIFFRGLLHDLSKYSYTEFSAGIRFYQGTRSPNEKEREQNGFSAAWLHHKGRNRHHFEYWKDYNYITKTEQPVKMPLKYVKEMFCDRVAASKIYMKDGYSDEAPLNYFLRGKATRVIHKETSELLESLLRMLSEKGEKETFKYIKKLK